MGCGWLSVASAALLGKWENRKMGREETVT